MTMVSSVLAAPMLVVDPMLAAVAFHPAVDPIPAVEALRLAAGPNPAVAAVRHLAKHRNSGKIWFRG
jgi:hypothetical protein